MSLGFYTSKRAQRASEGEQWVGLGMGIERDGSKEQVGNSEQWGVARVARGREAREEKEE